MTHSFSIYQKTRKWYLDVNYDTYLKNETVFTVIIFWEQTLLGVILFQNIPLKSLLQTSQKTNTNIKNKI